MNNDVQVVDVIDSLKEQVAELAYQVAYRDGVIKSLEKQVKEMAAHLEKVVKPVEPVEAIEE